MARLLAGSLWRKRLETAAGQGLSPQDVARLCVMAHLHDLGKSNRGFWARQFEGAPPVGHTAVTAALFELDAAPIRMLGELIDDWGAYRLFLAVMAHHGQPLDTYHRADDCNGLDQSIKDRIAADRRHWRADANYDPLAALQSLLDDARARFPQAFTEGPPLPEAPRFAALFGGLVTLADWLGSDPSLFPVAGPHHAARHALQADAGARAVEGRGLALLSTPAHDFADAFGFAPLGAQRMAHHDGLGAVALIEAETGAGKTEAALWRWLTLRARGLVDGLYFALPTRSAAVQLHGRVQRVLDAVFGDKVIEAVLAVPGYLRAGDAEGQALPDFGVAWDDAARHDGRWAAESPKRYLTARVAVGTVDQTLLAGLQVRHAHFRAASLARSLFVIDEVHASDSFMTEILRGVLANHVAVGGHALLLSATLAGEARAALLGHAAPTLEAAIAAPYPAIAGTSMLPVACPDGQQRTQSVHWRALPLIDDAPSIAARAVEAARAGASVLVVRNSVGGAIAVARAVEEIAPDLAFRVNGVVTLHHGRFAPDDRRRLDEEVEAAFGKGRLSAGRVLVGTQTLEQSLDIDADYLLTDLAPIDVLLQRIGRLHRHPRNDRGAFAEARADILVPATRDLTPLLKVPRHGLGPGRDGRGVYPGLLVIEATLRLIETEPTIDIPRDNRRLVESALHSEVLDRLATELGTNWLNHDAEQSGGRIADRGLARRWRLDFDTPFERLRFPDEEAIRTRLGADDRLIDFDSAPIGPFGEAVTRLSIPGWMAHGIGASPAVCVEGGDDGLILAIDDRRYRYSRFGLEWLATQ